MKLNNYEYVILLITKYIYIIPFSHSDYRICVARLTLKQHIIYLHIWYSIFQHRWVLFLISSCIYNHFFSKAALFKAEKHSGDLALLYVLEF